MDWGMDKEGIRKEGGNWGKIEGIENSSPKHTKTV